MKNEMKKTVNKILCVLLSAVMLFTLLPAFAALTANAAEIVASGYCGGEGDGTNLSWTVDSDGLVTISGEGPMQDFGYYDVVWRSSSSFDSRVKAVVVEEGVTSIGAYAFHECRALASVSLPDSLTLIGNSAFSCCLALQEITIPEQVADIGDSAFASCESLTAVTIPGSVKTIGNIAFSHCRSLQTLTLNDGLERLGGTAFGYCTSPPSATAIRWG